jgi:cell division protein FtsB
MAITQRVQDQTIRHADDLLRIENLEKLNQQLRKQVVDLNKQVEKLKKTQANPTAGKKKSGGLLHRS